ncbi:hypothetical protein BDZ91DRAFT_747287 [Kalaharituber pfeilii]|nr:hypothetical protein BDZ91DRAFT_747287 [Kalaharituber pfeilii]
MAAVTSAPISAGHLCCLLYRMARKVDDLPAALVECDGMPSNASKDAAELSVNVAKKASALELGAFLLQLDHTNPELYLATEASGC